MRNVLFIDHAFHQKTRSSDFFLDIIRQDFGVSIYYLDPDQRPDVAVIPAAEDADIIILWQMDFLAPVFLAMGKPVIVVPMFDGSGGMPDLHWNFAAGARFFNFSVSLHERIRLLGGQTMLLRYFPQPVPQDRLPRFDTLRGFFWERRPDHGIHFNYVDQLIGEELDSLHLHKAPDVPFYAPRKQKEFSYTLTESVWFDKRAEFDECLAAANVFVAPRVAEGIGMAQLEAMARGMLVLAHDAPTNNEYISNGINGILFHKDLHHERLHIRADAARLGRAAWQTVVEGCQKWEKSHEAIRSWVAGTPARTPIAVDLRRLFEDLWNSYFASLSTYENFLERHVGLLLRYAGLPDQKAFALLGGEPSDPGVGSSTDDRVDANGVLDLSAPGDRYTGKGWSHAEAEWRWAIGREAELHFSGLASSEDHWQVRFAANPLPELRRGVQCKIMFNGAILFDKNLGRGWSEYGFEVPAALVKPSNRMQLLFDKSSVTAEDSRDLAVCFRWFTFLPEESTSEKSGSERSGRRLEPLAPLNTARKMLRNLVK